MKTMKVWTEARIKALLATNQKAVYRALLVLDGEGRLPLAGWQMAGWVASWEATAPENRRFSYPLGLNKLREARRIVTEFAWRLTEIANENERRNDEVYAEIEAERDAEVYAERYYEDRYEDHPYDY